MKEDVVEGRTRIEELLFHSSACTLLATSLAHSDCPLISLWHLEVRIQVEGKLRLIRRDRFESSPEQARESTEQLKIELRVLGIL